MAKSLFDPGKAAGAKPAVQDPGTQTRPLTVSQAAELIKLTLERHTPSSLHVIGQISNLSKREHWYFSLKDESAVLSCVAWATTVRKWKHTPSDGDEVVVVGHLSHYGPQGKTQLYVTAIVPVGAGELELRFRALCNELRVLGYFDEDRKRALSTFPRRIAVITSKDGAAVQDVIKTASQRCKAVGLLIVDVKVQGEGAADEVARAIRWVDAHREQLSVDVILVTRGGGSIEDLWAFNERVVADAIYNSRTPVVAAIGHESDTTIAELVADVRASTPTQAVMRIVPSAIEFARQVKQLQDRLHTLLSRAIERRSERIQRGQLHLLHVMSDRRVAAEVRFERAAAQLAKLRPDLLLSQRAARLRVAWERLFRVIGKRVEQRDRIMIAQKHLVSAVLHRLHAQQLRLQAAEQRLAAVDPTAVLRRGYSMTTHSDGRVVRSSKAVHRGEAITTHVSDGQFVSIVASNSYPASPIPKKEDSDQPSKQFDLFIQER